MSQSLEKRAVRPWAVSWSAVWIGALAGVVAVVLFGFIGLAIGAQLSGPLDLHAGGLLALAWAVFAAFLAFVISGWVAATVAGSANAESGALHGAAAFLAGVVVLLVLGALGSGSLAGWYGGFGPLSGAQTDEVVRNGAVAAAAAILIGLIGSVVGGWMGSGETMDWATAIRRRT